MSGFPTGLTGGWDAISAIDVSQANALFLQQYLNAGPDSDASSIRFLMQGPPPDNRFYWWGPGKNRTLTGWLVDIQLGPPTISFSTSGPPSIELSMNVVRGSVMSVDLTTQEIVVGCSVTPADTVSGSVPLTQVVGEVTQLGEVIADFGTGTYQPAISGLGPNGFAPPLLASALQAYYATHQVRYELGSLAQNSAGPLQPTSFSFTIVPSPDGTTSALVMLIRTSGEPGNGTPPYPIPAGANAAVIISGEILFGSILTEQVSRAFAQWGCFGFPRGGPGAWSTQGSGMINAGVLRDPNNEHSPFSTSDSYSEAPADVLLNLNQGPTPFTISANGWGLTVDWQAQFPNQSWAYYLPSGHHLFWILYPASASLFLRYSLITQAYVDPVTDRVTFDSSNPGWLYAELQSENEYVEAVQEAVNAQLNLLINSPLSGALSNFVLPGIDAFAVASLLFPAQHRMSFTAVTVPNDLVLSGTLVQPLTITPASQNVQAGPNQTVQFRARGGGPQGVSWGCTPAIGTIVNGLYTAPIHVSRPQVVIVTAIDNANNSLTADSLIVLTEPAQTLTVTPREMFLIPRAATAFTVTDSSGNPSSAPCTCEPGSAGTLTAGAAPGQWVFQAGGTPGSVTITATDPSGATGVASIRIFAPQPVTLTPSSVTLPPGGTCGISASSSDPSINFSWAISPPGAGTVSPSAGAQTTYTAPQTPPPNGFVRVAAFSAEGGAMGIANIVIA